MAIKGNRKIYISRPNTANIPICIIIFGSIFLI